MESRNRLLVWVSFSLQKPLKSHVRTPKIVCDEFLEMQINKDFCNNKIPMRLHKNIMPKVSCNQMLNFRTLIVLD